MPGVEVIARNSVTITSSAQKFIWKEYGFILDIPANSLPDGLDQCQLDIMVSLAGIYKLPEHFNLFSAIYWVRTTPNKLIFKTRLTMQIQHCAKMTSSTEISFLRADCSQGFPYSFKPVTNPGSFADSSPYGALPIDHFCSFCVGAKNADGQYFASLYNNQVDPRQIDIFFVITKDTNPHIKVIATCSL